MKLLLTVLLLLSTNAFAQSAPSTTLPSTSLNDIAANADVGNGSTNVSDFDINTFDVKASLEKDREQIKADFEKAGMKCGPYAATTDRRETIDAMAAYSSDQATAAALTALYQQKKILKMYSIRTNHNIECSQIWVEIFTTDGKHLELYYGLND